MQVKKRNGSIVNFDENKIKEALKKASNSVKEEINEDELERLKNLVVNNIPKNQELIHVETIQNIIEDVLLRSSYKKTAKSFILYRDQHKQLRELVHNFNNGLVDSYINKIDWQVYENSNMTYSLQGLNFYLSSEVLKNYWLNKIYPPNIRNAYKKGDIHIHDLGMLSTYCVGWDLYELLLKGFTGAPGKITSSPAKHFESILGQIVNFFYTLQGEAAGAQAFSNFDTLLAPFIRYDKLTYSEVKQCIQSFIFNLNVPTRVGFQTPFTNLTLDLIPSSIYKDYPVIIGGKPQKETYKEFQKEMDMINKALLEVFLEGDASGRIFTFPIPTYNITQEFLKYSNKEIKELLWKVAGKYGNMYFANFLNSSISPEDSRSFCCRLRLDLSQIKKGGIFSSNPKTGSIGVVTINLPAIGYQATNKEDFFKRLDEMLELAKESLELKRKLIEKLTEENLYPYSKFYLQDIKERFGSYWRNHFSTIGIIGMNECILNFTKGKEDIASEYGINFSIEVLNYIRNKIEKFTQETNHFFNLEATPAEGASFRLALLDQKRFKDSWFANGRGNSVKNPFYTNSSQLPVDYTDDIFFLIQHQNKLQPLYTGGTVVHVFVGETISDPSAVENFIIRICKETQIPYFTITPTFSICKTHGFIEGKVEKCPKCDQLTEIFSRIVGYFRPVNFWNNGKKEEFKLRKYFNVYEKVITK
ncbi:MAG: ribonucleoside triphosphate reductase [Candidatus Aenigmatarchaeota archaeon]